MSASRNEFEEILGAEYPECSSEQRNLIAEFRDLVLEENEVQNLTRLLNPRDFFDGHVEDVRHLVRQGWLKSPTMDLGSGAGVPGIIAAILSSGSWILAESEGKKADFLSRVVCSLGLEGRVSVFSGRAEAYLDAVKHVDAVVARAVGPVERIYGWIGDCSTWNRLILFKGPGWDEEWKAFRAGRHRNALRVSQQSDYSCGSPVKQRKLVELIRVPRGTV